MATTKKLDLTDALEDRPETRKALEALQQEATSMKSYASALVASFQAVVEAQNGMCRSTDTLTQHLDRYKEQVGLHISAISYKRKFTVTCN
jgi:hypothetical protein